MKPRIHVMHVPGADPGRDANVAILQDLFEDVCVHEDPDRNGAVWNWANTVSCMALDTTRRWHVQLNDDAVPLRDVKHQLDQALWYAPRSITGLAWVGKTRGSAAMRSNVPFGVGKFLLAGLAIAYRSEVLAGLAAFAAKAACSSYRNDDVLACIYSQEVLGQDPAIVARSLFGTLDTKSLLGFSRYPTAIHTIEKPGPPWSFSFVPDNHMARTQDTTAILAQLMRSA